MHSSLEREKMLVSWLEKCAADATEIFLVGDVFDFWFEYKSVIPRGYTRLLGTLSNITDKGIPVHWFTGNHDMWIFDYLPEETGIILHRKPVIREFGGKRFFIGHGDGLGPGDTGYKLIKKVFANKTCQWLFARLHPNLGIGLANYLSKRSRAKSHYADRVFLGEENEWLAQYARRKLETSHFDYFIFGHRHLPLKIELNPKSTYFNLGDWLWYYTYGKFDGANFELLHYPSGNRADQILAKSMSLEE